MNRAEYWIHLDDRGDRPRIQCRLCPHACVLEEEQTGICEVRRNSGGTMSLPFYAQISSLALDPVEKKPLRHFMPRTKTFSVGFWHCNMRCPFCQNWEISHPVEFACRQHSIEPKKLIAMARESGCPSISFTYSEPTIHIEYVKEGMRLAHENGLATILVTNGNLLPEPAVDILSLTDATNVDLKCYSASTYHSVLGGELEVVKKFIQMANKTSHVEVTSLLVPGILDTEEQMRGIAEFLAQTSKSIPLHITAYRPEFRWARPPMTAAQMRAIAAPAFDLLENVHLSEPLPF